MLLVPLKRTPKIIMEKGEIKMQNSKLWEGKELPEVTVGALSEKSLGRFVGRRKWPS